MIKKLLYIIPILLLLAMSPGGRGGADHADFPDIYIDASAGAGGVGSEADPYDEFSDINWTTGGDNSVYDGVAADEDVTINLKKGETWRETLTVGASGASGHPVTIQAYGAGADSIINGADLMATWTSAGATVNPSVAANDDDYYIRPGTSDYRSQNAGVVMWGENQTGADSNNVGLRFQLNVPQGATISAATIQVKCSQTYGGKNINADVYAHDADNSSQITDYAGWNTAHGTLTAETVAWDIANPALNTTYTSPSLVAIVQEIVDRGSWVADNYIQFFIDNDDTSNYSYLKSYCHEHVSESPAVLNVTYGTPNVWQATCTTEPKQVFFDETRGTNQASKVACDAEFDWFWEANVLYVYSTGDPDADYTSPGIEAAARNYSVSLSSKDYITIDGLQLEKTNHATVLLNDSDYCIVTNNLFLQWTIEVGADKSAIWVRGANNEITANTFGENTDPVTDGPNWAGYKGVYVHTGASDTTISDNYFYHSGDESTSNAFSGYAIHLAIAGGTDTISGNTFYHSGSHSIYVDADTNIGDVININGNTSSYAGQAGVSLYQTRGTDGTGGTINVFNNTITYADRLAGTTAGAGNASNGIHLNDSITPDGAKPFVRCNIYLNTIHNCQALDSPTNEDSGGVGIDYNADNTHVYRNLIYDNYGKGIYIYAGNDNHIYYNIIYGNDSGITVSAPVGETADDNVIYNNVFYKNYNGAYGPGYNVEIYFGQRGDSNLFKNNTAYADNNGYAYHYNITDTSGCVADYNSIFQDSGTICFDTANGARTWNQWRADYPAWDANSVTTDPLMTDPASDDFTLNPHSPCVNAGTDVGLTEDYQGLKIRHAPDIGAHENQANAIFLAMLRFITGGK